MRCVHALWTPPTPSSRRRSRRSADEGEQLRERLRLAPSTTAHLLRCPVDSVGVHPDYDRVLDLNASVARVYVRRREGLGDFPRAPLSVQSADRCSLRAGRPRRDALGGCCGASTAQAPGVRCFHSRNSF